MDKIELIYCGKRIANKKGAILHHFKHGLDDLYYGNKHMPTHLLAVGCTYEAVMEATDTITNIYIKNTENR